MSDRQHKSPITHKIIAILLGVIALLLLAITIAVLSGDSKEPQSPTRSLEERVWSGDPLSDDDMESLKQLALSEPPLKWSSNATDWLYQKRDFDDWCEGQLPVPEVWLAMQEWLSDDAAYNNEPSSIQKVITNKPTGAQYEVSGHRTNRGASCTIKFVGNVKWK